LIFFIFSIASGFAVGSGIIIARRIGEGKTNESNQTFTQSTILMFLISIIITILFYFLIDKFVLLFNLQPLVSGLVVTYIKSVAFGIPAVFLVFHLNTIIRATGNSFFPMLVLIISNVLNAIIAPFLIFGIGPFPRMEMQGAGIAAAIAQNIGLILILTGVLKKYVAIRFEKESLKPDLKMYANIFKLGFPATLQIIAVSVNRILMLGLANSFGVAVLTTYMFGIGVDLFVFMSIFAIGTAIEIITGQNLGAGKTDRIFKYHRSAIKQTVVLLAAVSVLVFLFGEYFVRIFISDQFLISEIQHYLRIASIAYIPFSIGIISLRVVSGSGDYFRSFRIVAFIFFGIQLPFAYFTSKYTALNHDGIWYAILLSQIVFAVLALIALYRRKWMKVII
jgi:putative MATE family efflux protein